MDDGVSNEIFASNGVFTNLKISKKTNYNLKLADQYFDKAIYPFIIWMEFTYSIMYGVFLVPKSMLN